MAAETVDRAIKEFGLQNKVSGEGHCTTESIRLIGSDAWSPNMFISLIQRFGLETEVAKHLSLSYGDRAWTVCSYLQQSGEEWPHHGLKISPQYPFIEAEIRYAVHHEYAQTSIDFLSRRSRLSFLNARAALDALPRVVEIMGQELHWSNKRKRQENERATQQLRSMGITVSPTEKSSGWLRWIWEVFGLLPRTLPNVPVNTRAIFSPGELTEAKSIFLSHVQTEDGRLRQQEVADAIRGIKAFDGVKDTQVNYVIKQVGIQEKEGINSEDFIEICSNLKEILQTPDPVKLPIKNRSRIPVEKSGGGV